MGMGMGMEMPEESLRRELSLHSGISIPNFRSHSCSCSLFLGRPEAQVTYCGGFT